MGSGYNQGMHSHPIRNLGDGLILRRATVDDTDRLAAFHAAVHSDAGPQSPDEGVRAWVRDLMSGRHPTFRPNDFCLVEESRSGDVVSSLCLISQTWSYDGVPFGVGRPELVGTRSDYRRRGLVRTQMEFVHGWSAERGESVLGITGIPNYYRQFGYEMGLEMGGGRVGYGPQVPKLKDGQAEPYHVRPAAGADLPAIQRLYEAGCRRSLVACVRDEALWRYEITGAGLANVNRRELAVIEAGAGEVVGFLAHPPMLWQQAIAALAYELSPGVSWLEVTPSVVRYLWRAGETLAAQEGKGPLEAFSFSLGTEHPVYRAFEKRLPRIRPPYAWYVRVPDLPGFVRRIAPVLERRLAASVAPGYGGEIKISFYRDGLRMAFEKGRLVASGAWQPPAEPWDPPPGESCHAVFPDLTFLQLLFGYRSLEELKYAYKDCGTYGDEAPVLLDALFPRRASHLWEVA
jgi:hypothetical protein